jgi:hypothetical protein
MYQKLIGQLLYVSTGTRPDISASVAILSQKNSQPSRNDLLEVKRVIRYLKGTSDYALRVSDCSVHSNLQVFSDADWAENKIDRKSNSGYILKWNGGTVSWACRKQSCVSLSSTEAEYIAMAETCQETIWVRRLLKDFQQEQSDAIVINVDNQSCIKMIESQKFSNRTKHVDTKYHFVKDLKEKGLLKLVYCSTERNVADLLTKPLGSTRIAKLRLEAGVVPNHRGGV